LIWINFFVSFSDTKTYLKNWINFINNNWRGSSIYFWIVYESDYLKS
jgi:hypothetical protein